MGEGCVTGGMDRSNRVSYKKRSASWIAATNKQSYYYDSQPKTLPNTVPMPITDCKRKRGALPGRIHEQRHYNGLDVRN